MVQVERKEREKSGMLNFGGVEKPARKGKPRAWLREPDSCPIPYETYNIILWFSFAGNRLNGKKKLLRDLKGEYI